MTLTLRAPKETNEWMMLLLGAGLVYFGGMPLLKGLASTRWPRADGVITYSKPYQGRKYQVDLRFRYSFAGHEYSSNIYRFMFIINRQRMRGWEVDAVQARYPAGEHLKVAVNPGNPQEAVLEPGATWDGFLWPAFGLLLMFGGLASGAESRRIAESTTGSPAMSDSAAQVGGAVGETSRPRYTGAKTLLVIGGAVLCFGSLYLYKGLVSPTWPTTEGKILYSAARVTGNYRTTLLYEYHVKGTRYVAGDYRVGGNSTPFKDVAKAAAARYPTGRSVKVFYNPSNPAEAVLEPGAWYGNFVLPAIGLVILGVAFLAKKYADLGSKSETGRSRSRIG